MGGSQNLRHIGMIATSGSWRRHWLDIPAKNLLQSEMRPSNEADFKAPIFAVFVEVWIIQIALQSAWLLSLRRFR